MAEEISAWLVAYMLAYALFLVVFYIKLMEMSMASDLIKKTPDELANRLGRLRKIRKQRKIYVIVSLVLMVVGATCIALNKEWLYLVLASFMTFAMCMFTFMIVTACGFFAYCLNGVDVDLDTASRNDPGDKVWSNEVRLIWYFWSEQPIPI